MLNGTTVKQLVGSFLPKILYRSLSIAITATLILMFDQHFLIVAHVSSIILEKACRLSNFLKFQSDCQFLWLNFSRIMLT